MKDLTKTEGVVVRALLACEAMSEKERAARSGVPRRTFEEIQRRARTSGWVTERYVPSPARLGFDRVSFFLAQPFAEKFEGIVEDLESAPDTVVVWRWPDTLFWVRWASSASESHGIDPNKPSVFRSIFEMHVDSSGPSVSVYFDHEGAWSRIGGQEGLLGYPHPLAWDRGHEGVVDRGVAQRVQRLVSTPASSSGRLGVHSGPYFLPGSLRQLLNGGIVERRVFLNLSRIPPYNGVSVEGIVFVHGLVKGDHGSDRLRHRLLRAGVRPFLHASDGVKTLMGCISPAPLVHKDEVQRPAVLANIEDFLKNIEVYRLPTSGLRVIHDHTYGRLFG